MSRRLIVVGGSAAGMSAANVAKRRDPDLVVTVFEQGAHVSYSACGMPYRLGGEIDRSMADLVALTPDEARRKGIDVRTCTRVTGVDAGKRVVRWRELDGGNEGAEEYDELVLAAGSRPHAAVPVAPECGVHSLHALDDGIRLERFLDDHKPTTAVVVGAGFIGVETAEALLRRGLDVTVVHPGGHVLRSMLDAEMGNLVLEQMQAQGVRFVAGRASAWVAADGTAHGSSAAQPRTAPQGPGATAAKRARTAKRTKKAKRLGRGETERAARATGGGDAPVKEVLVEGEAVPAQVVVVATGIRPASDLARQAGCRVRDDGAVVVDETMRTGVEGVWACGDLVALHHRVLDESVLVPLALHSNRSGRIAGTNVAGGDMVFPGVLGTAATRFFDLEVASTGLTAARAREAGMEVVVGEAKVPTRAAYMPDAGEARVRMVAELATGRLLGVQLVGGPGTALRVDAAAVMVWTGATLEEVEGMDLAYNPPFSPVWDPLAIAARVTEKKRVPFMD